MKKYSAMAMFDDIFLHHRDVYLAKEVDAEIADLKESVRKVMKEYQFTRTSGFIPHIEWESVKSLINEINEVLD